MKANQQKLKALADKVFSVIQAHKSQIEKSNQELERLRFKQDQDFLALKQEFDDVKKKVELTGEEVTSIQVLYEANKDQAFKTGFPQIPQDYLTKIPETQWPSETKLHQLMWHTKAYQQLPALPSKQ